MMEYKHAGTPPKGGANFTVTAGAARRYEGTDVSWRRGGGMLERLKNFVQTELGIPTDVVFVAAGLALFVATCLVFRKPLSWPWALLPGICVAFVIEAIEIGDQYGGLRGLADQSAGEIAAIVLRHARDVAAMNLLPLLVVVVANLWSRGAAD